MPTKPPKAQTAPAPAANPVVPETPLEVTNPPGPAEGTGPGDGAGPPEGHDTPVGTDTTTPTAAEVVDPNLENSTEGDDPEGTQAGISDPLEALEVYLATHHRGERHVGEHPATTAVRLLTRLGAKGATQVRCQAPYCNLPAGHDGQHGWVHVEP